MIDLQTTLRKAWATPTYLDTTTLQYTNGVPGTAAADTNVTASGNTGFKAINNTNRLPTEPMALNIVMPGRTATPGQITATGGPTAVNVQFYIDYSDDGSTTVSTDQLQLVVIAISGGVGTAPGGLFKFLAPNKHKYAQLRWVITYTGGSGQTCDLGQLGAHLIGKPDNLLGNGMTDLG